MTYKRIRHSSYKSLATQLVHSQFLGNVRPESATMSRTNGSETWRNSVARQLLEQDIMNGRIPLTNAEMTARVVHSLRPEFLQLPFASFPRRLQALRASCKDRLDRGINDAAAYEHNLQFDQRPTFATLGLPRWEGSDAQRLFKN